MKTVSAQEMKDRLGIDIEQERRENMTLNRLCSFLHRVAMAGVHPNNIGLDGRVATQSLIEQGFAHPEVIAKHFIKRDGEYPLDGAHLKLYGGFFWTKEGRRFGTLKLESPDSRANFPNFSQEVDQLVAQYFPDRSARSE